MKKAQREFGARVRLPFDKVVCEPCPIVVKRACLGDHKQFEKVCSTDPLFPCSSKCGQLLLCGNHTCQLQCHKVEEEGKSCCWQCEQNCSHKYEDCEHQCILKCHPKSVPHPICEHKIKMECYCTLTTLEFKCFETKDKELVHERKQCGRKCPRKKKCGHPCSKTCHDGTCNTKECIKLMGVTCLCKRLKDKQKCVDVITTRTKKKLAFDSVAILECDEECG